MGDFKDIFKKKGPKEPAKTSPPPDSLNEQNWMEDQYRTKKFLKDMGATWDIADTLVSPNVPDTTALGKMYTRVNPLPEEEAAVQQAVFELDSQLREKGIELDPEQLQSMGEYFSALGSQGIQWIAKSNKQQNEMYEWLADRAADYSGPVKFTLSTGLGLLDWVMRTNTAFKLRYVNDDAKKAALEQQMLPVVPLKTMSGGEKFFSNATSASLWLIAQKTYGTFAEQLGGFALQEIGKLTGSEAVKEVGEMSMARGERRTRAAQQNVPGLVMGISPRFTWQDVSEANNPERWGEFYKWMGSTDKASAAAAGVAMSGTTALTEILVDPTLVFAELPARVLPFLREGVAAASAAKNAKYWTDAARMTHNYDDAISAFRASERYLLDAEKNLPADVFESVSSKALAGEQIAAAEKAYQSGKLPQAKYERYIHARRQFAEESMWFNQNFGEAGPSVPIYTGIPKKNPKMVSPEQARQHAKDLLGPSPGSPRNPYGPIDWADDMAKDRLRVLNSDQTLDPGFDIINEPIVAQARRSFGPDDAEYMGKNISEMARGGIVDDMTMPGIQAPDYQITPATPVSMIDWEQAKRANALMKAELEYMDTVKGPYKLGQSTMQMLLHEEAAAKKAYGAARSAGNKAAIALYEQKLKDLTKQAKQFKKTLRAASGDDKMNLTADQIADWFDESMVPAPRTALQEDPVKFNKWMEIAGDKVCRSLYPGGFRLGFWDSTFGRLLMPWREPRRFLDYVEPGSWDRVQGGFMQCQQWDDAMTHKVYNILKDADIIVEKSKFNPTKDFAAYSVNQERSEALSLLLDTPVGREVRAQLNERELLGLQLRQKWGNDAKIMKAHDELREIFDGYANMLGLSNDTEVRRLSGYLHHMITDDVFRNGARAAETIGLHPNASVFVSHLQKRTGAATDYTTDITQIMDVYLRFSHRKLFKEPVYRDILETTKRAATKFKNPAYAEYGEDLVAQLKGIPTSWQRRIDRMLEGALNEAGEVVYKPGLAERGLMGLSSMAYAGMLAGNPRYPVMQMATGLSTTVGRVGLFNTVRGVLRMATPEGQLLNKHAGTYQAFSQIFESTGAKNLDRLMRFWSKAATERVPSVSPIGIMPNSVAEESVRGMSFWASLEHTIRKFGYGSWEELVQAGKGRQALFQAVRMSNDANHLFGPLGRIPTMTRTVGRGPSLFATQFLSFNWKQTEELLAQASENPGKIMQYLAMSGYFARVAAVSYGVDLTKYLGMGYLPEEPDELTSPGIDMLMKIVEVGVSQTSNDPARAERAGKELMQALDGYKPLGAAARTIQRGMERLETQELRTATGRQIRPMDFANTMPRISDLGALSPGDIARSISPPIPSGGQRLLFSGDPNRPSFGGELAPTVFGLPSIRERMTYRSREAFQFEDRKTFFRKMRWVDEYIDALVAEDKEAAADLEAKLAEPPFQIQIPGPTALLREMQARQIAENYRRFLPELGGDVMMLDAYIQNAKQYGIGTGIFPEEEKGGQ